VKASGLAAGKGVIVCASLREADAAIDDMLQGNRFGTAGAEVLIEEFMEGEELSVFAITDGRAFVVLPGLQDHKRLLDDDRGPNTGGMGAYLPVDPPGAGDLDPIISDRIFAPTLDALAALGRPFTGLLYAGLMITREGPKVVEFNCRFGDPETQALLPVLELRPPLLDLMHAVATGAPLGQASVGLRGACVATVLAAAGYPDAARSGDPIALPAADDDVIVFHAGTARDGEGRLVTAGGRVLAVSAVAPSVADARQRSLRRAAAIRFEGKQLRSDIGWREIARARSEATTGARAPRD
jgi:phosphoribosylamine--glycine ligase